MKSPRYAKVIAVAVILFTVLGLSSTMVYAKVSTPITISFTSNPSTKMNEANTYHLNVSWKNQARTNYKGIFLFTVTSKGHSMSARDMVLSFNGVKVTPKLVDGGLRFQLPSQVLKCGSHGVVSVDVVYNCVGKFEWDIGVIQG